MSSEILSIDVPEFVQPPSSKLIPVFAEFNYYSKFLLYGGRAGGKSHFVARFLLYLGEKKKLNICCGRETLVSIDESITKIFTNVIAQYNLNYKRYKNKLINYVTGTEIFFTGLRECYSENSKGLEDVDILWIEEAQSISQRTIDVIIPTIRKENSKVFFTMNRRKRNDPVYKEFSKRKDTKVIKINYTDNKFCTQKTKDDAEEDKKYPEKYNHVWLGEPEDISEIMLFSPSRLDLVKKIEFPRATNYNKIRGMGLDLSGAGGDLCVANLIESVDYNKFRQTKVESWSTPDTDLTIGKVLNLWTRWKPDILTVDADGMGYAIACTLAKTIKSIFLFHGGETSNREDCLNARADGYMTLKDLVDERLIEISNEDVLRQLEYIEKEYAKRNGKIIIKSKKDLKKTYAESPDFGDSTMMNIYGITYHLQHFSNSDDDYEEYVEFDEYDPLD